MRGLPVDTAAQRKETPQSRRGCGWGDRVIRMGNTVTETNEQVHAALEAAAGAAVEVVDVKGEQRQTTLLPVWDTQTPSGGQECGCGIPPPGWAL